MLNYDPGHRSKLNCDPIPRSQLNIESCLEVTIQRWIKAWVIIQRGIKTRGHNSTGVQILSVEGSLYNDPLPRGVAIQHEKNRWILITARWIKTPRVEIQRGQNSILHRKGIKKTKCKGGGGGCEKNWGGICRRGVKKTKCRGRLRKKNWGGGVCRKGVKKTKCGRGFLRKKLRGVIPERGKRQNAGGGGREKKLRGVCGRGVEKTKWGGCEKNWEGYTGEGERKQNAGRGGWCKKRNWWVMPERGKGKMQGGGCG